MRRALGLADPLGRTLLLAALLLGAACTTPPHPATVVPPPEVTRPATPAVGGVTAVLFGYIPDAAKDNFAALTRALAERFKTAYPRVPLKQITIDPNLDLYDLSAGGELGKLLGDGPGAADVVEVDTLTLGDLVRNSWVQPLATDVPGILPAAEQAASINGQLYGVPTYLCSNVIYAHDPRLGAVRDGAALYTFLRSLSSSTPLVGNYAGSWILPSVYLDAWADTHGTAGLAGAYLPPVDTATLSSFAPLVKSCALGASNPCLDGTLKDNTRAESTFATGQANGYIGFTERLFYILSAGSPPVSVISAPLGNGNHPVMFVDALVVNRHCTSSCLTNAMAFIQFMSQLATRSLIAFSEDAPQGTFPRYLLQANSAFYRGPKAQQDPFYPQFWSFLPSAVPFPNQGFPEDRKALAAAVSAALTAPSPNR
jgi:thiamine pyridinylase